ncbi:MAG: response regulator transcription factor [Cyclobacteriaceae bacterium]|nr:response regulator transcription factor [Cyclobacteriaceae bacterium]
MKVALIDDEQPVRETLQSILEYYFPEFKVKEATGVAEGVELIKDFSPDLIFLDIKMGDGTGFDLLNRVKGQSNFQLIFVTAHNEYAVKAFKFSAIDYILKPVDPDEVNQAVKKAMQNHSLDELNIQSLLTNQLHEPEKIVLSDNHNIYLLDIKDIVKCNSVNNYTQFFLSDGREIIISKTLKHYEDLLKQHGFFRTHQSHIINLRYFDKYDKKEGGEVVLKDGSRVLVSSRKREELLHVLREFIS